MSISRRATSAELNTSTSYSPDKSDEQLVLKWSVPTHVKLLSGCSSTTNAHSETGQMAARCQNLPLGALSSRSALSFLVGELIEKFVLFLNTRRFRKMR